MTGALLLVGIAVAAWWPGVLPDPVAILTGQVHLAVLLVGTVGWLGADSSRQVRPWSILLLSALAATAIVIVTNQGTGTPLPTGETRFAHLAVLAAGIWLATATWRRRQLPVRRPSDRRAHQPAW